MARVKICGVTTAADARRAAECGAFAVGFNFHPQSPRCISPETGAAIGAQLPREIWRVGVFVDLPRDVVERFIDVAGLTAVQFHGRESIDDCRGWKLPVIKAIRVRGRDDVALGARYPVDFVLADAYVEGAPGGTGSRFDWTLLEGLDPSRLILAGGLTPGNVAEAVRRVGPYAVDVASGVEREPGVKDPEKLRSFIAHATNA